MPPYRRSIEFPHNSERIFVSEPSRWRRGKQLAFNIASCSAAFTVVPFAAAVYDLIILCVISVLAELAVLSAFATPALVAALGVRAMSTFASDIKELHFGGRLRGGLVQGERDRGNNSFALL